MQLHTKFGIPSSNNIEKKCSEHDYSKNYVRGQGNSNPKMVCHTWPSQVASTHQICNPYLKDIEVMLILETRSRSQENPPFQDAFTL